MGHRVGQEQEAQGGCAPAQPLGQGWLVRAAEQGGSEQGQGGTPNPEGPLGEPPVRGG